MPLEGVINNYQTKLGLLLLKRMKDYGINPHAKYSPLRWRTRIAYAYSITLFPHVRQRIPAFALKACRRMSAKPDRRERPKQ